MISSQFLLRHLVSPVIFPLKRNNGCFQLRAVLLVVEARLVDQLLRHSFHDLVLVEFDLEVRPVGPLVDPAAPELAFLIHEVLRAAEVVDLEAKAVQFLEEIGFVLIHFVEVHWHIHFDLNYCIWGS